MAGATSTSPRGTADSSQARATSSITPNTRVRASSGALATLADQLFFNGPSATGRWVSADTRVRVGGVPSVSRSALGTAFTGTGASTGPMSVAQGDPRVRSR